MATPLTAVAERSTTPPHHPTYGVHLVSVRAVVQAVFPDAKGHTVQQLPTGSSFNNRIYWLDVHHQPQSRYDGGYDNEQYVIKAMGRFWGAEKVQNEVACLWLLEKYCLQVPSPKVVAWSEDGEIVTAVSPDRVSLRSIRLEEALDEAEDKGGPKGPGWILMTRLPGEPVSALKLSPDEESRIGTELGGFVGSWRKDMPTQKYCGNVRIDPNFSTSNVPSATDSADGLLPRFKVLGLVEDGNHLKTCITTTFEYIQEKLNHKLGTLNTDDTYIPIRHLSSSIHDFVSTKLPKLATAQQKGNFVFTHFDLAPRNVLATRSTDGQLRVAGIVDFEFAGFFPPYEEFVNDLVFNNGDWPETVYIAYVASLTEQGIATPTRGHSAIWEEMRLLGQLEQSIAPWWLPGSFAGHDLAGEFEKAEKKVRDALDGLGAVRKGILK
jgi:hypothetical protein